MKRKKILEIAAISLPILIVILLMIPRLSSPQFGLLDDGAMLAEVRKIMAGDFRMQHDLQAGRFRPLYWGYFSLIYAFSGATPFWFFFGHTVLFLILVIQIWTLIKQMGGKPWQALLACLVFISSVPIVENFYTLSKGEPLQMVFVLLALIGFEKLNNSSGNRPKWPVISLIFFSILAALLVKETSMVMLPIAVLWAGFGFFDKRINSKTFTRSYLIFVGVIIAAIVTSLLLRNGWSGPSITGGTYTEHYDLSLMSLINKLARWLTLYAFYFHYLLPLAIVAVLAYFSKVKPLMNQSEHLLNWLVWVLIWIVALIPWEFTEVYYLLPFSIGISVLIGLIAPVIKTALQQENSPNWIPKTLLALAAVLLLLTFPNYYTHARTQLIIDRANQEMLERLNENLHQNGDAFIGMDAENEYVINSERFLRDQYARHDIHYDFVSLETLGGLHHYSQGILVLPYIRNQPDLIVRIGMQEKFTIAWRENIISVMDDRLTELNQIRGSFRMCNINLPVLMCPLLGDIGFCEEPDPVIDNREFRYGWEVYRIR
ncbi:MAG: hypothetical protein ACOCYU_04395 [Brevefilum sp.]